jgi:hypothetical protein
MVGKEEANTRIPGVLYGVEKAATPWLPMWGGTALSLL